MSTINSQVDSATMRAAVGIMTFEQAQDQLPVPTKFAALALKRLVARGAIRNTSNATVPVGGISVDAMKSFFIDGAANRVLRDQIGAPPESLLPILLRPDGSGFDLTFVSHFVWAFYSGVVKLINMQMPPSYGELEAAAWLDSPKWGGAAMAAGNTSVAATVTPEIKALIAGPLDTRYMVNAKGISQAKNFRNAGELFLVSRLQAYVNTVLEQREDAQRFAVEEQDPTSRGGRELVNLYSSPEVYAAIVGAAVAAMKASIGTIIASLSMPPLGGADGPSRRFAMYVSKATILQAAGTDYPRLASLAF